MLELEKLDIVASVNLDLWETTVKQIAARLLIAPHTKAQNQQPGTIEHVFTGQI